MNFEEQIRENMLNFAKSFQEFLIDFFRPYQLEKSKLAKSIEVRIEFGEFQIIAPEYIYFTDAGRRAGGMPPIANIRDWIIRNLSISDKKEIDRAAFAISKHISLNGIKGKFFLRKFMEEIYSAISQKISESLDDYIKFIVK